MPDTKISDLTTATAADGLEIPVNAAGTTKKIALSDALAHGHTHTKSQITDFTHTHATGDVTGLEEMIEDTISTAIVAGTNLTSTYDDAANTLTLDVDSHTHTASQVTDFNEALEDRVAALLTEGDGITLTYDDGAGTLTIDASAAAVTDETIQDAVASLLTGGSNITLVYDDAGNNLTISAAVGGGLGWFDVTDTGAVGDGVTDDRTAIEASIAAADAAGGGVVYFPEGTYMVSFVSGAPTGGITISDVHNVHFRGAGIGVTTLKQVSDSYGNADYHLFVIQNCTNLTFSEMTLDGNKAGAGTANDDASHLIEIEEESSDIRIFNIHFKDAIGDGVRQVGVSGAYGIERVTTAFCRFTDCGRGGWAMQRGARRSICAFNYFEGTSDSDISVETTGGGSAPSEVVVHGNIVVHEGSTNVAMAIAGDAPAYCKDWKITNNTLIGVDMDILRCEDFLIQGNFIHIKDGSPAIFIHNGNTRRIKILDNTIIGDTENPAAGNGLIKIEAGSGEIPAQIAIRGNDIVAGYTNGTPAIRAAAHEIEITDNSIRGNGNSGATGILFPNPAINATREGIRIEGNTITDFGTAMSLQGDANDLLSGLRIVNNRGFTDRGLTSAPNLAIGTVSAAKVKYDAFTCLFRGVTHNIAAGEVAFGGSGEAWDVQDIDSSPREKVYTISVTPSDTVLMTAGAIATAGNGVAPSTPMGNVKMGQVTVQHDGSAAFEATSTLLSAAHITDTYADAALTAAMTTGITFSGNLDTILDADTYPVILGNSFDSGVTSPLNALGTASILIGGNQGGAVQLSVSGTPEGNDAAAVGSTAVRRDGGTSTTFYVKETGTTTSSGWVAK